MAQDRAQRPAGEGSPAGVAVGPQSSLPNIRGGTYFLGRYRVVDEIGIGGMASVHLARMDGPGGFQKWVAIKRIHPHLVEDDTFVHMFLDEARVAARISHPNVATVFELGKHEDTYWIAMEYLHGEPLREVMRRTEELGQPMPPEIACRVIADAAEGLHAAHELLGKNGEKLGLVHRDVTPHNLFVTYDGNTKVVDFGIAKFSSRMASTRAGTLKGKLAYMSPEQVQGEQIDRRTDIFALGVVLWELTTGQRLFRMESDLDTLAKVQECNVPRPSTLVRGYPIDLEKIVMKALAKNKNERFRTARELSRALQSLLMRRGLFVASDEVAAYTQSIFQDRIRKREAHLRWAAEVTQTINIDSHSQPPAPPESWGRQEPSMVSVSSEVQAPTPQPRLRPAAGAPPAIASVRPPPPSMRQDRQVRTATGHSALTNPRPGAAPDTVRPPARVSAPPRAPAPHPAEDEAQTMRASPQALGIFTPIATDDDDFDDADDTIVTAGRVEFADGVPHFPTPVPAAGRPAPISEPAPPAPQRPSPPRSSRPPPPPMKPAFPSQQRSVPPPTPAHFTPVQAVPQAPLPPADLGRLFDDIPQAPRPPTPQHELAVTSPMRAPLPSDQKTAMAQSRIKPTPTWMLAAAAAFLGLMVVGLVFAVVQRTSGTKHVTPSATGRGPGPFMSARAAFELAATPPPPAPRPSATQNAVAPQPPPPLPPPEPSATAQPTATAAAPPPPVPPKPPVVVQPRPAVTPPKRPASDGAGDQGLLSILCLPACDQILDNTKPMGPSPIFKRSVAVGEHKLKLIRLDPPVTKVVTVLVMSSSEPTVVRQSMMP